jgi:hypothetical protein
MKLPAMQDQLVNRYLVPAELQCGIYLVYWIDPRGTGDAVTAVH